MDAVELKIALRAATGGEVELEDCKRLVAAADASGNGVVDFDEFKAICRQEVLV